MTPRDGDGRRSPEAERQYWDEVEAIFDAALSVDGAEREAVLASRCGARPAVLAEVQSLLAAHTRAGTFITPEAIQDDAPGAEAGGAPRPAGSRVGAFRLLGRIGQGGMGDVYAAERADGAFHQRVAIKLIAARLHGGDVVRRFLAERQILASLQHPNIVSLLDGGVMETRQPYIVLEYVDGVPITEFCRARALGVRERLRLVQQVCAAVGFAHRHLIVHRDLKPANVLVTGDGLVKVLDFGVAKLLEPGAEAEAVTATLLGPITPNYASPEQLRGLPVTTACDVYALGVMLYELLCGRRPYEAAGRSIDEMLAIVTRQEARRPSAVARGDLPYHPRTLRGDLDAVVLKAMAKEPDARYASAGELGEELERVFDGRPVDAQEPSVVYLARKAVARHRAAFGLAAVMVILLLAALAGALWQARIAARERARAVQRFNDVRELAGALIFRIHDQVAPLAGSTRVRETVIAEGLKFLERLEEDSAGDPGLQLELSRAYLRIGQVQGALASANLGNRAGALASYQRARELAESAAAAGGMSWEAALALADAHLRFAEIAPREEKRSAAESALRIASEWHQREHASERARVLLARAHFAVALASGRSSAAVAHWLSSNRLFGQVLADDPDDPTKLRNVALTEKYLGAHFEVQEDLAGALRHYRRALELDERRVRQAPGDRQAQIDLAIDLHNTGNIQEKQARDDEALDLYLRGFEIRRTLAASDPADVYARGREAFAREQIARVYLRAGRIDLAREHAERAVAINEPLQPLGEAYATQYATSLNQLAEVRRHEGRRQAACAAYEGAARALDGIELETNWQLAVKANAERQLAECRK